MTDTRASYSYHIKHYARFHGMYSVQDSDVYKYPTELMIDQD